MHVSYIYTFRLKDSGNSDHKNNSSLLGVFVQRCFKTLQEGELHIPYNVWMKGISSDYIMPRLHLSAKEPKMLCHYIFPQPTYWSVYFYE